MWKCKCGVEGKEHFYKSQAWYCKSCWNTKTAQRGKDQARLLKEEHGAKCSCCGYNKCMDALEFHHLDPSVKEFRLGTHRTHTLSKIRKELEKCILVCSNCHAEIHYKMRHDNKIDSTVYAV